MRFVERYIGVDNPMSDLRLRLSLNGKKYYMLVVSTILRSIRSGKTFVQNLVNILKVKFKNSLKL